jgi:hypothetical protein
MVGDMNMSENDGYTLDAEEQKRRIAERKKKQLEAEDFTLSPEEIERKKREATETEFQE